MKLLIFLFVFVTSLICLDCFNADTQSSIFKMHKINLIYGKAQKILGSTKLKDLMTDLNKHELDEITLKKIKAHNQDKDGLLEAAVRKKLLNILAKYSLEKLYHDFHTPIDIRNENKSVIRAQTHFYEHKPDLNLRHQVFRDKRLDKLWKKAEKSGLTDEQLMILHEEFEHQQDKIDEHIDLMNLVDIKSEQMERDPDSFDNSIDGAHVKSHATSVDKTQLATNQRKETAAEKKARLDKNLHQSLKEHHSGVKRGYDELHRKIVEGKVSRGGEDDDGEFEEIVVQRLWRSAKESNFNKEELQDLKEELHHYETRIKKLRHFELQLSPEHEPKKETKYGEDEKHVQHIKRRVKELGYKISELHKSLEDRILNHHTEL